MTDAASSAARCRVERRLRQDLDVVVVANDEVELAFLPQVGGRLVSCRFRGNELLWHNPGLLDADLAPLQPLASWPTPDGTMASWTNPGGNKTWPAPQGWTDDGQWHGPPDPVLDTGPYEATVDVEDDGTARVTLTSTPDPTTGIQISREFRLPATGSDFRQVSTFSNRSARPVTWAVWDVTQVDATPARGADGYVVVESLGEPGPVEHLFEVEGTVTYGREDQHWTVPSQDVVAKLGFPGATGTLEWRRRDGLSLRLESARREGTYPDQGCPVELWLQHPLTEALPALGGLRVTAHLVELEVLSPLTTLDPGQRVELETAWRLGGPATAR